MDTPRYVFGAQGFGVAWTEQNVDHLMSRLEEAGIQQFDTAALYPANNPGGSESLLGNKKPVNAVIDTKVLFMGDESLSLGNMGDSIYASLERLKVKKVRIAITWPDKANGDIRSRSTPSTRMLQTARPQSPYRPHTSIITTDWVCFRDWDFPTIVPRQSVPG